MGKLFMGPGLGMLLRCVTRCTSLHSRAGFLGPSTTVWDAPGATASAGSIVSCASEDVAARVKMWQPCKAPSGQ